MEFKDVMEWIDAMIEHNHLILPNDSVKGKISYISEVGEVFSISSSDLKKSIKNYPPNRESIILAEKALKGDKEPLVEYLNAEEEEEEEEEENDINENEYALSSVEKLIENVDPIDKYTKDLLIRMSLLSPSALDEWSDKSVYGRLLVAVLKNEGPKGEWLKIVLDSLK
jgi:hypothetical protein